MYSLRHRRTFLIACALPVKRPRVLDDRFLIFDSFTRLQSFPFTNFEFIMDYMQPRHLYSRLLENVPWKSGDSNVKGDPRKSVKWIDVSLSPPGLCHSVLLPWNHANLLSIGSKRYCFISGRLDTSCPSMGLRPLFPS